MKISLTGVAVSTLFLVACGKQDNPPSVTAPVPVSTATVPPVSVSESAVPILKHAPSIEIPSEIRGLAFSSGGKCSVDTINGKPDPNQTLEGSAKEGVLVSGWALDEARKTAPSLVVFQLANAKEKYHVIAERKTKRPDLATKYSNPEYVNAGYDVHVDTSAMPPDVYDVIVIMKEDATNLVCNTFRKIKLNG